MSSIRSLVVAAEATVLSLLIAYPIAYFLARKARPSVTRIVLLLFTIPFLINYIVRNVAWTGLLGRNGTINTALIAARAHRQPLRLAALQRFCRLCRADLLLHALHDLSAGAVDRRDRSAISRSQRALGASAVHHLPAHHAAAVACPASLPPSSSALSAASAKVPCRSSWAASAMNCSATPSPAAWMS